MKIIFWNIYNGFQGGPEEGLYKGNRRESMVADYLLDAKPDIVALLELQNFNRNKLSNLAEKWNHQHHLLLQGEFPMGFTSSSPLRRPSWNVQNMKHGFLSVEYQSIKLILCHIPPSKYCDRPKELRQIISHLIPLMEQNQPFLLLGDFNAAPNEDSIAALRAIGLADTIDSFAPRVDYVFSHPELSKHISVTIRRDTDLNKVSDHYPMCIELNLSQKDIH